jgi:hypothetical protein
MLFPKGMANFVLENIGSVGREGELRFVWYVAEPSILMNPNVAGPHVTHRQLILGKIRKQGIHHMSGS